jgi:hypothetical protein
MRVGKKNSRSNKKRLKFLRQNFFLACHVKDDDDDLFLFFRHCVDAPVNILCDTLAAFFFTRCHRCVVARRAGWSLSNSLNEVRCCWFVLYVFLRCLSHRRVVLYHRHPRGNYSTLSLSLSLIVVPVSHGRRLEKERKYYLCAFALSLIRPVPRCRWSAHLTTTTRAEKGTMCRGVRFFFF